MNIDEYQVSILPLNNSLYFNYKNGSHETKIRTWVGNYLALEDNASHYIIVYSGKLSIGHRDEVRHLSAGYYGVFPGKSEILTGSGIALVVSCVGHNAISMMGGPVEDKGRLRYIDNCTNTVLLPPSVKGEPCLNFLDLCPGVIQTAHTHPTIRIGLILQGSGLCGTSNGVLPLTAGNLFIIPPDVLHSFQSPQGALKIVIYHPDSVDGPDHVDNTMLNNTFVDGKSAQTLDYLHTKEGVSVN